MNCKISFSQRFTGCIITLLIGSVTVELVNATAATSVLAQPALEKTLPLQMAQSSSLAGNWRLVSMTESSAPTPMLPSTELTADFADDRVSGSGGCNRFMGGYQTQGEQLTIDTLASTSKACEESVMNQEFKYLTALQGAQRYEVDDQSQLVIFYQTEQESGMLRFTAQNVRGLW